MIVPRAKLYSDIDDTFTSKSEKTAASEAIHDSHFSVSEHDFDP